MYSYPNQNMMPFQHRPVQRPASQFVSGLIPLQSVITTLQQNNTISAATAAPAALPVGWLIALGGAFAAFQIAKTREGLAIGVALAMLAGEAAYEILYGIGQGTTVTPAVTPTP